MHSEPVLIATDFSMEFAGEFALKTPKESIADRLLMIAIQARTKSAADLAEADKVALVYVTGGILRQSVDGNRFSLTTVDPVGFYNNADGNVVVAYGPKQRPPGG